MPFLQLVERPVANGYALDVVDAPLRPQTELRPDLLPISAGSAQLLALASIASSVGLRPMSVHLVDRSGRATSDGGHALEEALLTMVRDHESSEASSLLSVAHELYVDRIGLEDPETRAVVYCTRRGVISIQGPAVASRSKFVIALLAGFRRVLGFDH